MAAPVDGRMRRRRDRDRLADMTALPSTPAFDTSRPFTRADAVASGLDPRLLRGSRFRRIFRGVYVHRDTSVDQLVRTQAALVLHPPDAFASHFSAARTYRLPVPHDPNEHVSVLRSADRRSRPGVRSHLLTSADPEVVTYRGVRVSAPFQMFLELASVLDLVDLVVVGDALVRLFKTRSVTLVSWLSDRTDRYSAIARRAAALVRNDVDSPMETRLRLLIVLAGLPEPEVNFKIRDEHGHVVVRLDLSYPGLRLIVEYDGRQHAEDVAQWNRDLDRRELFDDEEWRILVVTAKGIFNEPERTLERIRKALVKRGCPRVPRTFDDTWRRHFPGR